MTTLLPGYSSETGYLYRRHPYPLSIEELSRVYNQPAMSSERYGSRPMYSPTDVYGSGHGYTASRASNEADQLRSPSTMSAHYSPTSAYSPSSCEFPQPPAFDVPRVSESGMIVVRGFTPSEGEPNIPITVDVELHPDDNDEGSFAHRIPTDNLKLRLVLGCTAVKTTIMRMLPRPGGNDGTETNKGILQLRLHGSAPLHSETLCDKSDVPLTIQAMDDKTNVVESFTFGSFAYWTAGTVAPLSTTEAHFPDLNSPTELKRKRQEEDADIAARLPTDRSLPPSPKKIMTSQSRGDMAFRLVRTTNAPEKERAIAEAHVAEFEWVSGNGKPDPNDLDNNWTKQEMEAGRRLIRFDRSRSGNKLLVSCEVIPQEAYDDEDIVISCVYRQETQNCWFTSVDIIYLLERLAGCPFSVEEKNRIRRNLEGLKPTTVSKNKRGYEHFFQRIMDFPPPKPRNIEKDVKVFPWSVLTEALKKIISKYSVIPTESSDSSRSQGSSSPSWSGHSPTTSTSRSISHTSASGSAHANLRMSLASLTPLAESPRSLDGVRPNSEGPVLTPNVEHPPYPHPLVPNFSHFEHTRRRGSLTASKPEDYVAVGAYAEHPSAYGVGMGAGVDAGQAALHMQAFSNPYASNVNLASPVNAEFSNLSLGSNSPTSLRGVDQGLNGDIFKFDEPTQRSSSQDDHLMYPLPGASPKLEQDAFSGAMYPHFSSTGHSLLQENNDENV